VIRLDKPADLVILGEGPWMPLLSVRKRHSGQGHMQERTVVLVCGCALGIGSETYESCERLWRSGRLACKYSDPEFCNGPVAARATSSSETGRPRSGLFSRAYDDKLKPLACKRFITPEEWTSSPDHRLWLPCPGPYVVG